MKMNYKGVKKLLVGTILLCGIVGVQAKKAYEPFNYILGEADIFNDSGEDLDNGWAGPWVDGSATPGVPTFEIVEGIQYNGLSTPGNSVAFSVLEGQGHAEMHRVFSDDWSDSAGEVYYFSYITQTTASDPDLFDTWGGANMSADGNVGNVHFGIPWLSSGQDLFWGYSDNTHLSSVPVEVGVPVLVVSRIEMSGDENPEQLYIWVNPDLKAVDLDPAEADVDLQTSLNNGFTQVGMSGYVGPTMNYDEIALTTSWADTKELYSTWTSTNETSANAFSISCTPSLVSTSATIRYHLATNQSVKVSIFNTLGCEVAVLANETQSAGMREITFSADGLIDGVYICKLQAGKDVRETSIIVKK